KKKMPQKTRSEATDITGLNSDSRLEIEYTAQVVVTMGKTHVILNTLVTPNLQYDMLIGNEVLKDVELHTMTVGTQRYIYFERWNSWVKAEPGQPPIPIYVAAARTKSKPNMWSKRAARVVWTDEGLQRLKALTSAKEFEIDFLTGPEGMEKLRRIRGSGATKQVAARLKLDSIAREALELATQNIRLVPSSWIKQLGKLDYQQDEEEEQVTSWVILLLGGQEEAMRNRRVMTLSFLKEANGQEDRAIGYMVEDSLKLMDKRATDGETKKRLKDLITYSWVLMKAEETERIEIGAHKLGEELEDREISKYYLPTEEERMKDETPMNREEMLKMVTIGPQLDKK